jgi:Uma2 family endonuclease
VRIDAGGALARLRARPLQLQGEGRPAARPAKASVIKVEKHFLPDVYVPSDTCGTLAPDWACEVLSPSTEKLDRGEKLRVYARECVEHIWLIDPSAQTLEVLALDQRGRWTKRGAFEGRANVRAAPFDAIELELGSLWI